MKIDRVIAVLNDNEVYSSFWNIFSKVWRVKFGVMPTLMFVGSQDQLRKGDYSVEYGEIYRLDPLNEVVMDPNLDWSVTWALFYGPTLFPDDICMTSGIDQIPLSSKFIDSLAHHAEEDYIIGFSGAYRDLVGIYPSSHHVGKGSIYKQIYDIENQWHDELRKVFSSKSSLKQSSLLPSSLWGLDEVYSSEVLDGSSYPNIVHKDIFHDQWAPFRLDRGSSVDYDLDRLKAGYYSELHSPRPYELHQDYIDTLVGSLLGD